MATKLVYLPSSNDGGDKSTVKLNKLVVIGESGKVNGESFAKNGLSTLLTRLRGHKEEVFCQEIKGLKSGLLKEKSEPIHATIGEDDDLLAISVGTISTQRTRNNAIIRADLIAPLVSKLVAAEENVRIAFVVEKEQVFAAGCALARVFPQYSRKASFSEKQERTIEISFITPEGTPLDGINTEEIQYVADGIRTTAALTDMPCSELHTDAYIEEIKKLVAALPQASSVTTKIIQGEELDKNGFGGLWGVGKAAIHLPALVVLSYTPSDSSNCKNIALVGKGICYDTGGLSLKSTTGMPTMKTDMGGSAAILSAFLAAIKSGFPHKLHALLCLAENAVDQKSTRPDDILTLYSGKTVEVNNTDAEGRLVLGDGVAYASKDIPDVEYIIDMATLTGAQLIATGPRHAGFMVNHIEFEPQVIKAAQDSGDLAFPLIYAPEFLMKDLDSEVADMKNSNKNGPTTAASSLAGHFIESHLHSDYKGVWCHIDIAGPATKGGRATGYGVALLYQLLKNIQ